VLERLWSAWRASYVSSVAPTRSDPSDGDSDGDSHGSVFSRILRSGLPDDDTHIIHRAETCFVIANLFPYSSGHVLVVPFREEADLDGLTEAETSELWATVTTATRALRAAAVALCDHASQRTN
jgi:ATP adenylyltransferase